MDAQRFITILVEQNELLELLQLHTYQLPCKLGGNFVRLAIFLIFEHQLPPTSVHSGAILTLISFGS